MNLIRELSFQGLKLTFFHLEFQEEIKESKIQYSTTKSFPAQGIF